MKNKHKIKIEQFGPNHKIIRSEVGTYFVSFNSIIYFCSEISGEQYLGRNWCLNNTTSKYRNKFLGETTQDAIDHIHNGHYKVVDLDNKEIMNKVVLGEISNSDLLDTTFINAKIY